MNDKFYVYMSGGGRLITQAVVAAVVIAMAVVGALMSLDEDGYAGLIVAAVVVAVTLGGSVISALTTRSGDYILLTDEGISYRHLGGEKLFIGYGEAVAEKTQIAGMRGRRFDTAIVIGVRGSIPANPTFELRSFASLAEGWFVCAYNAKLAAALAARPGEVGDSDGEASAPTGVIDGTRAPRRAEKKEKSARRKRDDTHDDNAGDDDTGGWRFD